MGNMRFKVGNRVRIKSLDWYISNKNKFGKVWTKSLDGESLICFDSDMIPYCGMETVVFSVERENYALKDIPYAWTDEMIEGLVEKSVSIDVAVEETTKDISDKVVDTLMGGLMVDKSFNLPQGYIFKDENGNVINATKIVLEKKKKEYPKTYEECCKVLNIAVRDLDILDNMLDTSEIIYRKNLDRLLNSFRKLLVCRDAYWKLYGEEMGLGKPWEPNWTNLDQLKYCIWVDVGEFVTMTNVRGQHILAFPTEEMRDAFYENFKELIESCKELL